MLFLILKQPVGGTMLTETRRNEIQKTLGNHVFTSDFVCQNIIREEDLIIRELVHRELGEEKAEHFFINGWGIVLGAAYILEKMPHQLKISEVYCNILKKAIKQTIEGAKKENPFFTCLANGRMPIITHHGDEPALAWQMVDIPQTVEDLNQFIKDGSLKFEINKGCRLYLTIDTDREYGIFDKLWETNFSNLLKEKGLEGLERNKECPHLTLIDSYSIDSIRKKCGNEEQFSIFFTKVLEEINERLKNEKEPLVVYSLASKYCENYPLFEEIVAAKMKSPFIESALACVAKKITAEFGVDIKVTAPAFYHVTIAVKHRQYEPIANDLTVQSIIDQTGDYSKKFNQFWTMLKG